MITPTYDGICAEKYIEWELAIDNIFSQCRMREWRKIQNATSILTDSASDWWDKLCESDKPRIWNHMKTLMRETFIHVADTKFNTLNPGALFAKPGLRTKCASQFDM